MPFDLEYHRAVPRWIPASVALFGLLAFSAFLVPSSQAQINGAPASVTSPGFGGHAINGTPASVTSLGRGGFTPGRAGVTFSTQGPTRSDGHHSSHHRDHDRIGEVYAVPYAVPYPYVSDDNGAADAEDDADYQGGPTVFDRRGLGANSYIPPAREVPVAHSSAVSNPSEPESPQDPTTLVFKDGHQIEVGNYAIVGQTLYDLTPSHPRKVALADLDLRATEKQNDDHGVSFQLPPGAQAN
jgi:hypothetical protein